MPVGGVRDQDAADRRGVLKPAGQVDRVADHREIFALATAQVADHHRAGVDADAHGQADAALALELLVQLGQRRLHIQRRAHRPLGIALLRGWDAEDRHHRIADELLDPAALARDRRREPAKVGPNDVAHILGIHCLGSGREAGHIGEQHRDLLAALVERGQVPPQRGDRRIGQRIAERGAARLDRGDGLLDVFALAHMPAA